jgi:hypothetical protein
MAATGRAGRARTTSTRLEHDDVIATQGGWLISFDTALHSIRWEVQSQFTGQPSLAQDRIAKAVAVNVTVVGAGSNGHLRLGESDPAAVTSTLNYLAGLTRSNNAFVALGAAGDLNALAVQSAGTTVHLIIDVSGYFE